MFFLRNLRYIQLLRYVVFLIVYLLMPFDLIPERVLGAIGYLDDLIMLFVVVIIIVAIIAVQYIRANQWFFKPYIIFTNINKYLKEYDICGVTDFKIIIVIRFHKVLNEKTLHVIFNRQIKPESSNWLRIFFEFFCWWIISLTWKPANNS